MTFVQKFKPAVRKCDNHKATQWPRNRTTTTSDNNYNYCLGYVLWVVDRGDRDVGPDTILDTDNTLPHILSIGSNYCQT